MHTCCKVRLLVIVCFCGTHPTRLAIGSALVGFSCCVMSSGCSADPGDNREVQEGASPAWSDLTPAGLLWHLAHSWQAECLRVSGAQSACHQPEQEAPSGQLVQGMQCSCTSEPSWQHTIWPSHWYITLVYSLINLHHAFPQTSACCHYVVCQSLGPADLVVCRQEDKLEPSEQLGDLLRSAGDADAALKCYRASGATTKVIEGMHFPCFCDCMHIRSLGPASAMIWHLFGASCYNIARPCLLQDIAQVSVSSVLAG